MPNTYVLMCTVTLGTSSEENEGVFDSVSWVSPTVSSLPDPATGTLTVQPGDQIGFAVQVKDSTSQINNGLLNWVAVAVSACTMPGNRLSRLADNNSPFRIGANNRPNTVLLATDEGGAAGFAGYDANGNSIGLNSTTGAYGTVLDAIVADVPPGASSPARKLSQYECVVTCSISSGNSMWQYTFDPEVDVENGN